MFWKKPSKSAEIEVEKNDDDRRSAFRVDLTMGEPVLLSLPDCDIGIHDLSAGGVSFQMASMKKGMIVSAELVLPNDQGRMDVKMKIKRIAENDIVHAEFEGLTEQEEDKLHYFVLCHQKRTINR